jgi:hypothetical protein
MSAANRMLVGVAVAAILLGAMVAGTVMVGMRPPTPGERLPCGHLAHTVFELRGVKKTVCVNGHAWTRLGGRWMEATEPFRSPP